MTEQKLEKLLPCPMCSCVKIDIKSNKTTIESIATDYWRGYAKCRKGCIKTKRYISRSAVIKAWNTRASTAREAELQAEVEKLKITLENARKNYKNYDYKKLYDEQRAVNKEKDDFKSRTIKEYGAEVERLRKVLEDAAKQITSTEMMQETYNNADFVGAYDTFILKAKQVLNQGSQSNETN